MNLSFIVCLLAFPDFNIVISLCKQQPFTTNICYRVFYVLVVFWFSKFQTSVCFISRYFTILLYVNSCRILPKHGRTGRTEIQVPSEDNMVVTWRLATTHHVDL